jgi:Uma2 family endonuclease
MVAILSPEVLPMVRMTVDEYMPADLPEGYRYELVKGVVQMAPFPAVEHDDVLGRPIDCLYRYRSDDPGRIAKMTTRGGLLVPGEETVREPDLCVYRTWPRNARGYQVWKELVPFLVVEVVSPGQGQRDYEDKREDYWEAGVEEYWFLDPHREEFTALTRQGEDWRERTFDVSATYRPEILPEFELPVGFVLKGE